MNEPYRYLGQVATAVCENGHFSSISGGACETCEKPRVKLQILTNLTRQPVKIYGYLVKPLGYARVDFEDGSSINENVETMTKNYVIPGVVNPELTISRLFSWEICTR
jgi:hypothetical protein